MDVLGNLLQMIIPSSFILYGVYMVVRHQLLQEKERLTSERLSRVSKESVSLRLQAYERICLLLERTSPAQLVPRVLSSGMNALVFQASLLREVRNELNHNLSQQVYMSKGLWQQVRAAIEETLMLINESAEGLDDSANAQTLAKRILERTTQKRFDSIENALDMVREEIKVLF